MKAIFKFMEDNHLKNLFLDGWEDRRKYEQYDLNIFCFHNGIKICRAYGELIVKGKTIPVIFLEDMLE